MDFQFLSCARSKMFMTFGCKSIDLNSPINPNIIKASKGKAVVDMVVEKLGEARAATMLLTNLVKQELGTREKREVELGDIVEREKVEQEDNVAATVNLAVEKLVMVKVSGEVVTN